MSKNIAVGIDIGTAFVQTVIAKCPSEGGPAEILGMGRSRVFGVRRGVVFNADEAAESIKKSAIKAQKQAKTRIDSASVSIGGVGLGAVKASGMVAVSRASGEISGQDVERVLDSAQSSIEPLSNKEIIHRIPLVFTIDNEIKTMDPAGINGARLEADVLFITVLLQDLKALTKSFETAVISIEDIVASPIAVARAALSKRHKEVGAMVMDIGSSTVSLAVFEEGVPISLEVLPIGSSYITNDIAIGFKTGIDNAEAMKMSFKIGQPPKDMRTVDYKQLHNIISARVMDIFELTSKHLKKIRRERLLPGGVVITGGGSGLADVVEAARDSLSLPAHRAYPEEIKPLHDDHAGEWSAAIGLCLMAIDEIQGDSNIGFAGMSRAKNTVLRWLRFFLP